MNRYQASEYTIDNSAQDESLDEYNDDTFGSSEPITDDWEFDQQKALEIEKEKPYFHKSQDLPDFFRDQPKEEFLEEGLEAEGQETYDLDDKFLSMGSKFPTANQYSNDNEEFFTMDEQLEESKFMQFIDEDDETPKTGFPQQSNYWNQQPPESWSGPRGPRAPQEPPRNVQSPRQPEPNNPLAKLLGALTSNPQPAPYAPQLQPNAAPPISRVKGVLSVEELEARLRSSHVTPQPQQMPPQMPPGNMQGYYPVPVPQQIPHGYAIPPYAPQPQPVPQSPQRPVTQPPQPSPQPPQQPKEEEPLFSADHFPVLSRNMPPSLKTPSTPSQPVPIKRDLQPPMSQSPQSSQMGQSPSRLGTSPSRNLTGRPKWRESKSMMSAFEIETIIRMQEAQLLSGNNPFAEDFYFATSKSRPSVDGTPAPFFSHKPLFESNTKVANHPHKKPGADPLEGVLGRIPSHSVKAPRMLLQLSKATEAPTAGPLENGSLDFSQNANTSSKAIQSLLLTIENAFNFVIDIEDIDSILKHAESATHFNIPQLRSKREEFTFELFKSLHVHTVPFGQLPQRGAERESDSYIFPEDEVLMSLTFVHKGRKLLVRALPLLFQDHVLSIFFVFLRNFAALVGNPRIEMDIESTNRLFALIFNIVSVGSVTQTVLSLQTILAAHADPYLIIILQSKFGLPIVQALLKRAHDVNLSPFSREDPIHPDIQKTPLGAAGYHWKEALNTFVQRLIGKFNLLFNSELGQTERIWEFFAVLVVNMNSQEKRLLLTELREKVLSFQMNSTLAAFLQLAQNT